MNDEPKTSPTTHIHLQVDTPRYIIDLKTSEAVIVEAVLAALVSVEVSLDVIEAISEETKDMDLLDETRKMEQRD